MTNKLKPIVGQHLLSFPENWVAPFNLYIKDGHNLILFNPSGESKEIPKDKFLATLIKLFNDK
jgi:hypothetical protein